jgi:hypothetical protein
VARLWVSRAVSEDAGEVLYEEDMPGCCQRSAYEARSSFGGGHDFDCPGCGASWQALVPVEPEECAFTERPADRERKGAA